MTDFQWKAFCEFKQDFITKIEEWNKKCPQLMSLQEAAAKAGKTPAYSFETPIVYNRDLDRLTKEDEIKLIVIGDNPGKDEQLLKNNRYLVGQAGKIADGFFKRNPELGVDFRKNVIILNKTPVHSAKTNQLKYIIKNGGPEVEALLQESQLWMAQRTAKLHAQLCEGASGASLMNGTQPANGAQPAGGTLPCNGTQLAGGTQPAGVTQPCNGALPCNGTQLAGGAYSANGTSLSGCAAVRASGTQPATCTSLSGGTATGATGCAAPELWLVGYSELKGNGIFIPYKNRLKESYLGPVSEQTSTAIQNHDAWSRVFVFQHFSMNRFTIDLNDLTESNGWENLPLLARIHKTGTLHKQEIFE